MIWTSAISLEKNPQNAVADIAAQIQAGLGDREPHLLVLFVSAAHHHLYTDILQQLDRAFPRGLQIGCTASGVIGRAQEVEAGHAIAVTAAHLPGVLLKPIYLDLEHLPDADAPPDIWRQRLGNPPAGNPHFLLLADPFNAQIHRLLEGLDYVYPDSGKFGGLASGSGEPGGNRLILDRHVFDKGAVLLAMSGKVQLDIIVAQGCRPIGRPTTVTQCAGNAILEIENKPALDWLSHEMSLQSEEDQRRAKTHLFIGLSMDPFEADPQHGEFLIRNLVGVDYGSGAIVVGDDVQQGQIVRFHLRDREASRDDLDMLLTSYRGPNPNMGHGLLMFSCLGRGEYLYRRPNHDSGLITEHLGQIPITGCFCSGEIGPVGLNTQIHGYTSVLGIFREPSTPPDD